MGVRLPMNTQRDARQTFSRLIRKYHNDEIETDKFRALTAAFSTLLAYFKHDADLRIEERLDAIEDAILTGGKS